MSASRHWAPAVGIGTLIRNSRQRFEKKERVMLKPLQALRGFLQRRDHSARHRVCWQTRLLVESLESRRVLAASNAMPAISGTVFSDANVNALLDPGEEVQGASVLLFADDTKIFRSIRSAKDAKLLQSDIDALSRWSQDWLINFNLEKCPVLTIGKFERIKRAERYKLDEHELEHVFEEKDL